MSYVLMKVLESAPSRYDRGINFITLGKISKYHDRLAHLIKDKQFVLDIGCGTGAMSIRAARKGAYVTGIDVNPQMLEIAGILLQDMELFDRVHLREQGVAELSNEPSEQYDVVICSLVFSELTEDERVFAIHQIHRLLKPEGMLLIIDETRPTVMLKRILYWFIRIPLMILTYVLTQTTTRPITDLSEMVGTAGFTIKEIHSTWLGDLTELIYINTSNQEI